MKKIETLIIVVFAVAIIGCGGSGSSSQSGPRAELDDNNTASGGNNSAEEDGDNPNEESADPWGDKEYLDPDGDDTTDDNTSDDQNTDDTGDDQNDDQNTDDCSYDQDCTWSHDCYAAGVCQFDADQNKKVCAYQRLADDTVCNEGNGTCQDGICQPCPDDDPEPECETNDDCADDSPCVINECVDGTCVDTELSACWECDSHEDCEGQTPVCVSNMVVRPLLTNGSGHCSFTHKCEMEAVPCTYGCSDGACNAQPECLFDQDCVDDDPCTVNEICEQGTCHRTEQINCTACEYDADCNEAPSCDGNEAQGQTGICLEDGRCEFVIEVCEFGCDAGECLPEDEPECRFDSDCSESWVCVPSHDGSVEAMLVHHMTSCVEGLCWVETQPCHYGCEEGACLPEPEPDCNYDSDCEESAVCMGDMLMQSLAECNNGECAVQMVECEHGCLNGACQPEPVDPAVTLECTFSECREGFHVLYWSGAENGQVECGQPLRLSIEGICNWGRPAFHYNQHDGNSVWDYGIELGIACNIEHELEALGQGKMEAIFDSIDCSPYYR